MQRVHAISIDKAWEVGRAADAADRAHAVIRNLKVDERLLHRSEHAEVAATRAPVGIDLALEIGQDHLPGSFYVNCHRLYSSHHDLVGWHGKRGRAGKLLLHRFDNVVRHEGLSVVLPDMPVGDQAALATQIARELATIVVLHDNGGPRAAQNFEAHFTVPWAQPAHLQ